MAAAGHEVVWLASVRGGDVRAFFAELGVVLGNSPGENVDVRCFANPEAHRREDRNASCSVNMITGTWRCHGCGARGNAFAAAQSLGLPDQRARQLAQKYALFLEGTKGRPKRRPDGQVARQRIVTPIRLPRLPTEKQLGLWREALVSQPPFLERLEELKGWTHEAIVRCGLGWDGQRIVFPIRDDKLKLLSLSRYVPGGKPKMLGLPGRERGLFPAPEALSRRRPLFIVEGEPAAVSMISCHAFAVGVPGKDSWRSEWARRLIGRKLIILPDCDPEGRDLAYRIHMTLPMSTVVDIDPRRHDGTDIGDWITEAVADGGHRQMERLFRHLEAA